MIMFKKLLSNPPGHGLNPQGFAALFMSQLVSLLTALPYRQENLAGF
jgi:hypothetical protein